MSLHLAIGIGCSSSATADHVVALIASCEVAFGPDSILATLDRRADIGEAVATILGLQLMLFSADILARTPGIMAHSTLAQHTTGTPSIAEASSLAAIGPGSKLLVPRRTGRFCTCAMAVRA